MIFSLHLFSNLRLIISLRVACIIFFMYVGTLRVWNIEKAKCVYVRKELIGRASDNEEENQNITQALHSEALQSLAVVTFDNNITLCKLQDLSVKKQVG